MDRSGSRLRKAGVGFVDGPTACGTASSAPMSGGYFTRAAHGNGLRRGGIEGGTVIFGKGNYLCTQSIIAI